MKNILFVINDFTSQEVAELSLENCHLIYQDKADVSAADVKGADAIIGNIRPELLKENPDLEWLQSESAGVNQYLPFVSEKTLLTCATGSYGVGISEYMITQMLNIMKKIPAYIHNEEEHRWHNEGSVLSPIGKRVLIVGTGNIGQEFAKRVKALGARTVGLRRHKGMVDGFDEVYQIDALKAEVGKADVIAICLPGSPSTYHLFDQEILESCRKGAILMNVGRGSIIDTNSLILTRERFRGIWLDVTEEEPLPADSPLWDIDHLLITPHISGGYQLDITLKKLYQIVRHNLHVYLNGGDFISVVDKKEGYAQ